MAARIVITEFMDETAVAGLRATFDVHHDPELWAAPESLLAAVPTADALIVRNRTQVTAEVIAAAPGLRCIGRLGVGLDNLACDAARARGILIHPATGANAVSVAEYVIAMALTLLRPTRGATDAVQAGGWPRAAFIEGREVSGRTMGIIGFGDIGRTVASRARALGMQVAAYDAHLDDDAIAAAGATPLALDALLASTDVLTLHMPLTTETRGLLGPEAIARMKPDAVLIDAGRGGIVDVFALTRALKTGQLGGAALDVLESEPPDAETLSALQNVPNLILTPHIAGGTVDANRRVSTMVADAVRATLLSDTNLTP